MHTRALREGRPTSAGTPLERALRAVAFLSLATIFVLGNTGYWPMLLPLPGLAAGCFAWSHSLAVARVVRATLVELDKEWRRSRGLGAD